MNTPTNPRNVPIYFKYWTVFFALAIFFLACGARLIAGPRTIDDAFITFRYSRNILAGNGFVYNPGEHVLGTTTPFYTILLAIVGSFTGGVDAPFPQIALCINALADGFTCLLLFMAGRRAGYTAAGAGASLVWSIAPFSVTFAIGGLETSVFILLLTGLSLAHLHNRRLLASALAALALLTRPDALILIGPIAFDRLLQVIPLFKARLRLNSVEHSSPKPLGILVEIMVFVLPVLIWVGFSTSYFGSPLPHSIAAKSLAYRLPPEAAFVRLLQHYATPFLEHLTFGIPAIAAGLILFPFLFLIGARQMFKENPSIWPWLAYPWFYFAVFSLANPLIFRWYLSPPLPSYFLGILVGLESLLRLLVFPKASDQPARSKISWLLRRSLLYVIIIVLPLLLSLRDWKIHPDHGIDQPAPEMAWYQLELLYRQAVERIAPEISGVNSSSVVAAGDVGVIGFFSGAQILDTVGLNTPISTRYYPLDAKYYVINYAIPPKLILDVQPDYVIILEVYGRAGLLIDPEFNKNYRLLQKIPTDIYGSDGMLIYTRTP